MTTVSNAPAPSPDALTIGTLVYVPFEYELPAVVIPTVEIGPSTLICCGPVPIA